MSGSDATMFAMLLSSRTGKPSSAHTTRQVATCGGTVRARKRQPATPILSTVSIVTSNALGNRLNCITARSEEHTSELQSLMRISYAVFCLKKKTNQQNNQYRTHTTNSHTYDNQYKRPKQ